MKTLLVMRHGKSKYADQPVSDIGRPLTGRGKRDAVRMAKEVAERGVEPDLVISSVAKRARSTAKRVVEALSHDVDLWHDDNLYMLGTPGCYRAISRTPDSVGTLMLVGHNPTSEELVAELARRFVGMPTAAVACIDLDIDTWSQIGDAEPGRLRFTLTPRELPD